MQDFLTYLTENLSNITLQAALRLVAFGAMLFLGIRLIKWFLRRVFTLERFSRKRNVDPTIFNFLHTVAAIALYVLLVFTCASILNLPMTGFMTALGSIGLAIGLALQGGLSNLAGSVLIAVFRPFGLGDYIETGDTAGTVKDIGLFYTTLQTFDNRRIIIPNGSLSGGTITNYSTLPTRRVDLEFSAAYASDIDRVNGILLRVASSHPLTLEDPAPFARLLRQDSSALVFVLRVWCKTADYWTVRFDLNEQVKKAFDQAGVEIPFPQLDVHSR